MSPPIRDGSGNDIGAIRLGDGSEISEVRTGAGDVLFSAAPPIPDSGTALYVVKGSDVDYFSLSTPWDISTKSEEESFDISSQTTNAESMVWNNDGSKFYIMENPSGGVFTVYEYTTSSYSVSGASFSKEETSNAVDGNPVGLAWSDDGSKFYVGSESEIVSFDVGSNFDISGIGSASTNNALSVTSEAGNAGGYMAWNNDGTSLLVVDLVDDNIYEYTLSTGFDLSTGSYANNSFDTSGEDASPRDLQWRSNGSELFVSGLLNDVVIDYNASQSFDITSLSADQTSGVGFPGDPTGLAWATSAHYV